MRHDDEILVTASWLDSLAGWEGRYGRYSPSACRLFWVDVTGDYKTPAAMVVDDRVIQPLTRGRLRTLCECLNIPLGEPTP